MNLAKYTSLVFDRLSFEGDARNVDNGIVEFMETLCAIEDELLEFEVEVSKIEIDWTGIRASRRLEAVESQQSEYLNELSEAHEAILLGHLTRLERNPAEKYSSGRTQHEVSKYQSDLQSMVSRLEDILERIGRRVDAKRNSANSRMVLTVAAIAGIVSLFALIGQLIGLLF